MLTAATCGKRSSSEDTKLQYAVREDRPTGAAFAGPKTLRRTFCEPAFRSAAATRGGVGGAGLRASGLPPLGHPVVAEPEVFAVEAIPGRHLSASSLTPTTRPRAASAAAGVAATETSASPRTHNHRCRALRCTCSPTVAARSNRARFGSKVTAGALPPPNPDG